jgi:rhodanese-related sulfurtransferase
MSASNTDDHRKPGVATDDAMDAFLAANAGRDVYVLDARNPDFTIEPDDEMYGGDGKSAPISQCGSAQRPKAVNVPFLRDTGALDTEAYATFEKRVEGKKDAPVITHCGGGGRGQKAKDALEKMGYTNVINGGGPAVKALWKKFGAL